MAFAINNRASQANYAAQPQREKAVSFLNLYMPRKDGGRTKVGAIAFFGSKPNDKALHDWLMGDPARQAKLKDLLELDFKAAAGDEATLDLPT